MDGQNLKKMLKNDFDLKEILEIMKSAKLLFQNVQKLS